MKFELHPSAAAAFNEQGNVLAESLSLERTPTADRPEQAFSPEVHISGHLSAPAKKGIFHELNANSVAGNKVTRFVNEGSAVIGL